MRNYFILILIILKSHVTFSQATLGNTGLLNIPTAEMQEDGTFMFGANYLPEALTPERWDYNTGNYFLNLTFLPFLEISYRMTLFLEDDDPDNPIRNQDRSVSVRLSAFKEGNIRPALVVGGNDIDISYKGENQFFSTFYLVSTKNIEFSRQRIATTLGYAHQLKDYTNFSGFFGGISFQPLNNLPVLVMAEYDTHAINAGVSATLFKHLYLYGMAYDMKYLAGGFRFIIYLKS